MCCGEGSLRFVICRPLEELYMRLPNLRTDGAMEYEFHH